MSHPIPDNEQHDHERQWMLAIWGTAYTLVGLVGLYFARHTANPWHLWLNVLGLLLTVVGGGCLLWFVGFASILGLDQIEDTRPVERACLLFAAVVGCWAVYLIVRI
ncbi:MAG: hypothetical protein ACLPVY_28345 [Acidimicrobiia bacterium]